MSVSNVIVFSLIIELCKGLVVENPNDADYVVVTEYTDDIYEIYRYIID